MNTENTTPNNPLGAAQTTLESSVGVGTYTSGLKKYASSKNISISNWNDLVHLVEIAYGDVGDLKSAIDDVIDFIGKTDIDVDEESTIVSALNKLKDTVDALDARHIDDFEEVKELVARLEGFEGDFNAKLDRIFLKSNGDGADPTAGPGDAYYNIGTYEGAYVEHLGSNGTWRTILRRANCANLASAEEPADVAKALDNFVSNLYVSRMPITDSVGRLTIADPSRGYTIVTTEVTDGGNVQHRTRVEPGQSVYVDPATGDVILKEKRINGETEEPVETKLKGELSVASTNTYNSAVPLAYADDRYLLKSDRVKYDKVLLDAPLKITTDWGLFKLDPGKSYKEIGKAGMTLKELFTAALVGEAQQPTVTYPELCIRYGDTPNTLNDKLTSAVTVYGEMGSTIGQRIAIRAESTLGSYTYGSVDSKGNIYNAYQTGVSYATGKMLLRVGNGKAYNENAKPHTKTYYPDIERKFGDPNAKYSTYVEYAIYTAPKDRTLVDSLGNEVSEPKPIDSGEYGVNLTTTPYYVAFVGYWPMCSGSDTRKADSKNLFSDGGTENNRIRRERITAGGTVSRRYVVNSTDTRVVLAVPKEYDVTKVTFYYLDAGEWVSMGAFDSSKPEYSTLNKYTFTKEREIADGITESSDYTMFVHTPVDGTYGTSMDVQITATLTERPKEE